MAKFIKGDVVVVPFPFSDLTQAKRRPALICAVLEGDDVILCQITGKNVNDAYAITLQNSDFSDGELKQESNIRPNRIFTADTHIILYKIGAITQEKMNGVTQKIIEILQH